MSQSVTLSTTKVSLVEKGVEEFKNESFKSITGTTSKILCQCCNQSIVVDKTSCNRHKVSKHHKDLMKIWKLKKAKTQVCFFIFLFLHKYFLLLVTNSLLEK